MSAIGDGSIPAPTRACRITVCIPARNEAASIRAALAALTAQRTVEGRALPRGIFDVIIFANNCTDDTAAVARDVALRTPELSVFVVEDTLQAATAHIGTARKYVMDLATNRFLAAGRPSGVVASLDSDSIADPHWIAWMMREIRGRDAVAGFVTLGERDHSRLPAPVRRLYARELTYRRILAELEGLVDPLPYDPAPRHGAFVGASFAVTARTYRAAGGIPALHRLEDLEFSRALGRIDARVRHSSLVRATTSARRITRVSGGFGTFLADLHERARHGESFSVEHPLRSLEDIASRAAIRRIRQGTPRPDDVATTATIFALPPGAWLASVDPALPLGTVYEGIAARAERRPYPPMPVEFAIATLRTAVRNANVGS